MLKPAELYLNTLPMDCRIGDLELRIHYWGAQAELQDNPVHRHSFFEVCYVLNGEGNYTDDGEVYSLQSGTLFLSRPGVWHQIHNCRQLDLLWIAFELRRDRSEQAPAETFERCLLECKEVVLRGAGELPAALYWRAVIQQAAGAAGGREQLVQPSIGLMLLSLAEAFGGGDVPRHDKDRERAYSQTASKTVMLAKQFIRDNLSQPLSLQGVAQYLHMSDRHLSRLFQQHSELSFAEYVKQERIRVAEFLLKSTNVSIKQIAEMTGFTSVHYFTRVFAEAAGCPPGEYRKAEFGSSRSQ